MIIIIFHFTIQINSMFSFHIDNNFFQIYIFFINTINYNKNNNIYKTNNNIFYINTIN